MLSTVMDVWQHAPDGWSFVAGILASVLLILAWRGPAYIAALSAHALGLREQNRLDRLAQLKPTAANDAAASPPSEETPLRFPSRSAPRLVAAPEEDEEAA